MQPDADEAAATFQRWIDASCPPGATPRNYSTAAGVGAQTIEGALAAIWQAVCSCLEQQELGGPSLTVVLLPLVPSLADEAKIVALERHLLACRDCCAQFGRSLQLQMLHPSSDGGRDSPVPAFTLSSRVGPPLRLGTDGQEDSEEQLQQAKAALERLIQVGGEREAMDSRTVLAETVAWFEAMMPVVFRLVGARQRRRVVRGGAEELYRAFWAEAALLIGEAEVAPDDEATTVPVDSPLSSLLVLPGLEEASEFRKLHRSLALSLATLQLEDRLSISAFHPADTFQINTADDGTRTWRKTLDHPLLHLVCKVPIDQRVTARRSDDTSVQSEATGGAPAGADTVGMAGRAASRPPASRPQVRVVSSSGLGQPVRELALRGKGEPPPPAGFEWGLSI